jgi:hypothetical protein
MVRREESGVFRGNVVAERAKRPIEEGALETLKRGGWGLE